MIRIAIATDTGSGITQAEAKQLGISAICMPFTANGTEYYEGLDLCSNHHARSTMSREDFFRIMEADADLSTSQPVLTDLIELWDTLLESHDEIVYLPFSSGLSGSYQTAFMLAKEEEYEGRVFVCDVHKAAVLQRLCVMDALRLSDLGYRGAEIRSVLEREAGNCSLYAIVATLKHLKKGGRITSAVAAFGTLLKLRPILQLTDGGKLDKYSVARTDRQSREALICALRKDLYEKFRDPECRYCQISVLYSDNPEEAKIFARQLEAEFPDRICREIRIDPLGLNVCCHAGPGALGISVYAEPEELRAEATLRAVI